MNLTGSEEMKYTQTTTLRHSDLSELDTETDVEFGGILLYYWVKIL